MKTTIISLAFLLAGSALAQAQSMSLIGPEGEAIAEATIYEFLETAVVNEPARWRVEKHTYSPDLKLAGQKEYHQSDRRMFLVVEAQGYALGVWQDWGQDWVKGPLKLQKDFSVTGFVKDEQGNPVSDADVLIGRFGLSTYTNVTLNLPGAKLPFFSAKTEMDGSFRFRGIVLEDYGWDVGAELYARKESGASVLLGSKEHSFIGPQSFFDEARKAGNSAPNSLHPDMPLTMIPAKGVSGSVKDAITGKPLAQATVAVTGRNKHPHFDQKICSIDQEGRFKLQPMQFSNLRVSLAGYQECRVSLWQRPGEPGRQREVSDDAEQRLAIPLRRMAKVECRVILPDNKKAADSNLRVKYLIRESLDGGQKMTMYGRCSDENSNRLTVQPDGSFTSSLPIGSMKLKVGGHSKDAKDRFYQEFSIEVKEDGPNHFNFEIASESIKVGAARKPPLTSR